MSNFNPDDWDFHWSKSNEITTANPGQQYRHRVIAKMIRRFQPSSLIDFGCGQGDFLRRVNHDFPEIELNGLELSNTGVQITTAKVPKAKISQVNLLSELNDFPINTPADLGTCIEVLEHLENPEKFLRNAQRFLNANGILIVSVPSGPKTAYDIHIGHRQHFTNKSLGNLLSQSGSTVLEIKRYGWPFFNLYRLLVLMRGKRLIEEVASNSINGSKAALTISKVFNPMCRFNIPNRFLGWQLIAICQTPNPKN